MSYGNHVFLDAYETLADVPGQAQKAVESVQGKTIDATESVASSDMGEVEVAVASAKVRSIWLDEQWLQETDAAEVADTIRDTVNKAWAEWSRACMEGLQQATPEMREVTATIDAARTQLRVAFNSEMERVSRGVVQ